MPTPIAIRQSIKRRNRFDPISLFESGLYKGFWLDPSDISTLSQNDLGTTSVNIDGDPVGYVRNKSGLGGILTRRLDDTCRPIYKISSNSYPYLLFDGSNDGLTGDTASREFIKGSNYMTSIVVGRRIGDNALVGSHCLLSVADSSSVSYSMRHTASPTFFSRINGVDLSQTGSPENLYVFTTIMRHDNISPGRIHRVSGVEIGNLPFGYTFTFGSGSPPQWFTVGHSNDSLYAYVEMYQVFIINKLITGSELIDLEKYLASRAGLAI